MSIQVLEELMQFSELRAHVQNSRTFVKLDCMRERERERERDREKEILLTSFSILPPTFVLIAYVVKSRNYLSDQCYKTEFARNYFSAFFIMGFAN